MAQISAEYATLLAEKKERYDEYKTTRKGIIDYQTAKNNVDRILGLAPLGRNGKTKGHTALICKLHIKKTHLACVLHN